VPVVAVVAVWIALLVRARRAYLGELARRAGAGRAALDGVPGRPVDEPAVEAATAVMARVERRALLRAAVAAGARKGDAPLLRALGRALGRDLVALGRLLLASYPASTVAALAHLAEGGTPRCAAALELLDNLLRGQHRELVPRLEALFLDGPPAEEVPPRRDAVKALLEDEDPRLRALAVHLARGEPELVRALLRSTQDRERWVREAAWRVLALEV
jgi:hypothetical protein